MNKRTVFITGSSRGIGLGIARAFANGRFRLALNGRGDEAALNTAVCEIRRAQGQEEVCGENVFGVLADLSDYAQAQSAFSQIEERLGSVDILVNNAGIAHFGLFTDTSPSDWDMIMRNNFTNVLNTTHLAVPKMVRAKSGVIINITSVWGETGASCEAVYAAAKGAVHAFTKSMAQELGPSGIRVCAVACGAIDTRMNARLSPEERACFTERIPLSRFGMADEVGKLVYFLASDEASYLTGQIIRLDGGLC